VAAHDRTGPGDPRKRQTATATPAKPGDLLWILDELTRDLTKFVERLVSEKILLTAPEDISELDHSRLDSLGEYQGFIFERHAEMEDLLTLDPIHDVDPKKGWPNT
jgi:hypothetical protein